MKTIKCDPRVLKAFLVNRAKLNAAMRKSKELREQLQLPEPCRSNQGEYILIGKGKDKKLTAQYTIFFKEGFVVEANWIGKIS